MATADKIPVELALEIGADFDPKKFVSVAREFFGFVGSVSAAPNTATGLEWRVKVREGSNILALVPEPSVPRAEVEVAYARIERATSALVSGDFTAAALDDDALEHARKLSDMTKARDGVVPMSLWVNSNPILFGPDVADFIREETRLAYWDFGSIEGTMNAIQDGKGGLELRVKDPLWQRTIKCFVPESMLADAIKVFRRRVELFGEIRYRKDDTPEIIHVDRLVRLPDDDELPSIAEVRGLLVADEMES